MTMASSSFSVRLLLLLLAATVTYGMHLTPALGNVAKDSVVVTLPEGSIGVPTAPTGCTNPNPTVEQTADSARSSTVMSPQNGNRLSFEPVDRFALNLYRRFPFRVVAWSSVASMIIPAVICMLKPLTRTESIFLVVCVAIYTAVVFVLDRAGPGVMATVRWAHRHSRPDHSMELGDLTTPAPKRRQMLWWELTIVQLIMFVFPYFWPISLRVQMSIVVWALCVYLLTIALGLNAVKVDHPFRSHA